MPPCRPLPGRRALVGSARWQESFGLLPKGDHRVASGAPSAQSGQESGGAISKRIYIITHLYHHQLQKWFDFSLLKYFEEIYGHYKFQVSIFLRLKGMLVILKPL